MKFKKHMWFEVVHRADPAEWTAARRQVEAAYALCQNAVTKVHVRDKALPAADAIVLAWVEVPLRRGAVRSQIRGWALVQRHESTLFLDVMCASQLGRLLVEQIKVLALGWGCTTLVLHSLAEAIGFWLRMGFVHTRSPTCRWPSTKLRRQAERVVADRSAAPYLTDLRRRNLTARPCKTLKQCAEHGYIMRLCLVPPPVVHRRRRQSSTQRRRVVLRSDRHTLRSGQHW